MIDGNMEPRFIQIGRRAFALDYIVSVEMVPSADGIRVEVYMVAPIGGGSYTSDLNPNSWSLVGDAAERFLDWWYRYGAKLVL